MGVLDIKGVITGIKYKPSLCRKLKKYNFDEFDDALVKESAFVLDMGDGNEIAISSWVSAKRTRSYPYERVYNTLSFAGKKITIIPVFKDEGLDGDRDFLQWDTISLMSLLGINVIVSYYESAEKSSKAGNKKGNKITNQRFDTEQIKSEMKKLLSYRSDALHWNLLQIDGIGKIGEDYKGKYDKNFSYNENSIYNLTLLPGDDNSEASHKDFSDKIEIYKKYDKLPTNKKLIELYEKHKAFNLELIEEYQEFLWEKMKKIFYL